MQATSTSQQQQIRRLLPAHGWEVAPCEPPDRWWVAECWSLRSTWSPLGEQAWVLFLADPQTIEPESSGRHVWAVTVVREIPNQWQDCEAVPLRPNWEARGIHQFTAVLGRLRHR